MMKFFYTKYRHLFIYGSTMAILVFLLKWLQWKFLIIDNAIDIYVGLIALFFTALGVWVAMQLTKHKVQTVIVEKEILVRDEVPINQDELNKLKLSDREYEVLQQLALGSSNAEIADQLCLSLSTIKTHASNLFVKLEVRSRTQAIEKAKRLRLIR